MSDYVSMAKYVREDTPSTVESHFCVKSTLDADDLLAIIKLVHWIELEFRCMEGMTEL